MHAKLPTEIQPYPPLEFNNLTEHRSLTFCTDRLTLSLGTDGLLIPGIGLSQI